jgi:Thermolysin metallopeptidase, alpha-helical domain/Thermolysin metallopeptidase, catalytic domain
MFRLWKDSPVPCSFVPPYLLRRLALSVLGRSSGVGQHTLELDRRLRSRREESPARARPQAATAGSATASRLVHTADHTETLPGVLVRTDGDPPTGDQAVDEAFDSSGQVLDLFATEFGRRSTDGRGSPVSITVHFGQDYDNAFWDGAQLVFGDGDGVVFDRFTKPMDVMAHEFTHGVTQFTAGLAYLDQSGALNESVSDVFAAMAKQRSRAQTAEQADWLIAEGLFLPTVNARALRSMLEPGTAYDDPRIGRDPQVGRMADYVTTEDDNGGVHINSGIPNRAFALAAGDLGGFSWERVGPVWYDALTAGEVPARSDFATFARATLASAARVFPTDAGLARAIAAAWRTVGVLDDAADPDRPVDLGRVPDEPAPATVAVRRSGGFAGLVRSAELDLDADPEGPEVRMLLSRLRVQQIDIGPPTPDRFTYTVRYGGWQLTVPEPDLTPELRRVVSIVLSRDQPRRLGPEGGSI